jgi:threonine dehydrogenase-like Zn-dependent dehydrogenase
METMLNTQRIPAVNKPKKASAAIIRSPHEIEIANVFIPEPGWGEVRIKLEGCGVCASSIPVWEGRDWFNYPVSAGNPGHEGWGIVDMVGSGVDTVAVGDRVACLSYNAFALYDMAKADEVVLLPEFLDGKPFPGEPLGCAMNIFERSDIRPGDTVAIVGAGFLGVLLVELCKSAGANVIAVSRREFSLETASAAGADHCIAMDDHYAVIEKVKQLTDGRFCDRVIEVTGKEWPLNLAIELTRERGKLVVAGFHQDGMRQVNMQLLNWRGIDMINAHERDSKMYIYGIRKAITAIETRKMDPFPYFTHTYTLSELNKAFTDITTRPDGFIKALIINE